MQTVIRHFTDMLLGMLGLESRHYPGWSRFASMLVVVGVCLLFDLFLRLTVGRLVLHVVRHTRVRWDDELFTRRLVNWGCHLITALLLMVVLPVVFDDKTEVRVVVLKSMQILLIYTVYKVVNELLASVFHIVSMSERWQNKPIKGLRQTGQGIAAGICGVFAVSVLIDKSPAIFLTGLGASAAVVLLIFRDSILGFVSGIQLAANDMVREGDWISVPKYGANGNVEEVSLTTVKIRNWDNSVQMLPPYLLVSESFINWHAMQLSGGRRVMRSVLLDVTSIVFCTRNLLEEFARYALISEFVTQTLQSLDDDNRLHGVADAGESPNGRHITNLEVLCAYMTYYLENEVPINRTMPLVVRPQEQTPAGLPLQLYFFVDKVDMQAYEAVQTAVMSHLMAVVPYFRLRLYQSPSGVDMRELAVR